MIRILDSTTGKVEAKTSDGKTRTVEQLTSVTFLDHDGSAHTLTFAPEGANVAGEAEDRPRIVGTDTPHYSFTDPAKAVAAYQAGEIT